MSIRCFLAVAFVLAIVCSCANDVTQQPSTDDVPTLSVRLIEGEWRIFSLVYPSLPTGGYPIAFHPGGHLQTKNLDSAAWRLTNDQVLVLSSTMSLSYDAMGDVFVSQPESGPAMIIGPAGFAFQDYLETHGVESKKSR